MKRFLYTLFLLSVIMTSAYAYRGNNDTIVCGNYIVVIRIPNSVSSKAYVTERGEGFRKTFPLSGTATLSVCYNYKEDSLERQPGDSLICSFKAANIAQSTLYAWQEHYFREDIYLKEDIRVEYRNVDFDNFSIINKILDDVLVMKKERQ